jgi:hypothetical protein
MTNTASKTEIIDAILKNREIIKNRIHLKQFKEHLTVRRSPRDRPRTLARRQGAEIAQITGTG